MMRLVLHAFVGLLTFTTGVTAWDFHLSLVNHGINPIKRILRIKPEQASPYSSEPSALSGSGVLMEAAPPTGSLYPPDEVIVLFGTDLTGRVVEVHPMSGGELFHQQAIEATFNMRFPKRRYRGYRVGTRGRLFFKFVNGRRRIMKLEARPAIEYVCLD